MAHARWWDFVAPPLADRARVFALDRRGHGDSEWAEPARYGWERDLLDAEAVMSELAGSPWIVGGHSQGGLQAVPLALRRVAPIVALVLVDVPLYPASPRLSRTGDSFRRIRQMRYPSLESAVESFRPFPSPHRIPPERLRYIAHASFRPIDGGPGVTSKFHWDVFRAGGPPRENPLSTFPEQLAALEVPTLALRGEHSTILTAEEHRRMVDLLRHGRGVVIPDATHNPHAEAPDQVAAAMVAFLDELGASRSAG